MRTLRIVLAIFLLSALASCSSYRSYGPYGSEYLYGGYYYGSLPYYEFGNEDGYHNTFPPAHYTAWQDYYGADRRDERP